MDDLYPNMITQYKAPLTTLGEVYVYGSFLIGILGVITLACFREPRRYYRIMKRKNTDESPIIQA
jgi:hypothetical protein